MTEPTTPSPAEFHTTASQSQDVLTTIPQKIYINEREMEQDTSPKIPLKMLPSLVMKCSGAKRKAWRTTHYQPPPPAKNTYSPGGLFKENLQIIQEMRWRKKEFHHHKDLQQKYQSVGIERLKDLQNKYIYIVSCKNEYII